ncbi:dITP/XTP pyrophosphatase [Nitrospira tepida]|uniref:dITP/XTP pyrophosphatase n=1 Tax=Nitrospira tepida TaxID=2973512 RepID=A0AA86T545_9BACT|nr:XTP/dITP diphosphatase [Nitrospira tepida]CAI4031891.1 dITP/XTP pyrophosphatase [Nitrospira tepida]
MELIVATRNKDKCKELQALLQDLGVRIRTIGDFPGAPDVVEDGTTCEANAIKKAQSAARFTGLPAIADDTGLEVAALDGRPGVYAARYAGESATYEDNWRKLLRELNGVPVSRRQARFVTAAAIAYPDGRVQMALGTLDGVITEQPRGTGGFGYDPVFLVPEKEKTLAEMTPEEKNQVSHRARAFQRAKELLQEASHLTGV